MDTKQHQVTNQIFTLLTARSAGNEWTIAEVNKLKQMRAAKVSVRDIAVALGRTYYAVTNALLENNLTTPRNNNKPSVKVEACPTCFLTHSYRCEM